MPDDKFNQDLARVEAQGKTRFGEQSWQTAINAIGKSVGAGGIPEAGMRQILAQPDPAQTLYVAGKEALLQQSDAGDSAAEAEYRQLRQQEREAFRKARGRS